MPLNKELFIGFDGGGTKTVCIVGDASGNIVSLASGASTNLKSRPEEAVREVIHHLLSQVLHRTDVNCVKGVYVSTAGGDRDEDRNRWKNWIFEYGIKPEHLVVNNDAVGALAAGTKSLNGMVLIAGTGSIAYSVRDGLEKPIRVGGWGYLFGDEGSGYDIGSQALRMVIRSYDGREPEKKAFTDYLLQQFGLEQPNQLVTYIYENPYPRQLIASVAQHVVFLAEQGNEDAQAIVQKAIDRLIELVLAIFRKDGKSKNIPLVVSGGLFHSAYFKGAFERKLRAKGFIEKIILPDYPPVVGSYICALLGHGEIITEEVEQNINKSWQKAEEAFTR